MNDLTLIKVHNPFNRHDHSVTPLPYHHGQTLLDLRNSNYPQDVPVVVSVNGRVIPRADLALSYPTAGDEILFIPEIHGGGEGGKTIYRTVLMIAVAVAAFYTGQWYAMAYGGQIGAILAAGAVSIAGGMLVNTLLPPPRPQVPTLNAPAFSGSQLYSWSPQTMQQPGLPIPVYFGVNKIYGNIIETYTDTIGDSDTSLNVLLSCGMGPQKRLYDFKIDDQPASYFNLSPEARLGHITQDGVPGLSQAKIERAINVRVETDSPYTYTTPGNNFDALEVEVLFPNGLFYANDGGGMDPYSVALRVRMRKAGGAWTTLTTSVLTIGAIIQSRVWRWSLGQWIYTSDGDANGPTVWMEWESGGTGQYDHVEGDREWRNTGSVDSEGNAIRVLLTWRLTETTEVNQSSLSTLLDSDRVTGGAQKPIRKKYVLPYIVDKGQYEVSVENLTASQDDPRYGEACYVAAVREVTYDNFTYPRQALVGITAIATDKLSGGFRFSCMTEGVYVRIWNGSAWYVDTTSNPAWVVVYLLTQPVFDNSLNVIRYDGCDPSRIDVVAFLEWANWCDTLVPDGLGGTEKRITFNGGFDATTNVWDAVHRVAEIGRALVLPRGNEYTVVVDKPATPVQLFTTGNVNQGSFRETWLPVDDRASEIKIDFINGDKDYARDLVSVSNPDLPAGSNPAQMQLFGVVKATEAWRHGRYRLACNEFLLSTAEWEADIDAIVCNMGDVVNMQHDIPTAGSAGGRLAAATSTTATLDQSVTIEAGKSYTIWVRVKSDVLYTRSVTNAPGTYSVLNVSVAFDTVPEKYDIFAFGEAEKIVKPYRVLFFKPGRDLMCKLSAIEYNETIYNTDSLQPALPTPNYSALVPLPPVTGIVLIDTLAKTQDGSIAGVLDVYFSKPSGLYLSADVWYNAGGGWLCAGNTVSGPFRINNPDVGKVYSIAIVTVNTLGKKMTIGNAPKEQIQILGKLRPPQNITNFTAIRVGGKIQFSWDEAPDLDVWGYEIRRGTAWAGGEVLVRGVAQNNYIWDLDRSGTHTFWIKALDTSEKESVMEAQAQVVVPAPPNVANVATAFRDDRIVLIWDRIDDTRAPLYYEIRQGPSWAAGQTLGSTLELSFIPPGDGEYWVAARYEYQQKNGAVEYSAAPATIVLSGVYIPRNEIQTWDEYATGFSGDKGATLAVDGSGYLFLSSTSLWDAAASVDAISPSVDFYGMVSQSGIYTVPDAHIVDLGYAAVCTVSASFFATGAPLYAGSISSWESVAAVESVSGASGTYISCVLQLNISIDGTNWLGWQNWHPGDYYGRKFKMRVLLSSNDPNNVTVVQLQSFAWTVDMPDRTDKGTIQTSASANVTVTYSPNPFQATPYAQLTILAAVAGDTIITTSSTASAVTFSVYNGGSRVVRTVNWLADRY